MRFWHLASLGAGVTLLALASDPFVQQSVAFPLRKTNVTASIPFAQEYRLSGRPLEKGANDLEQCMKAAIYDSIMYSNISETGVAIQAQCATGNRSFPEYASIEFCSKCVNVTSKIEKNCTPVNKTESNFTGVPDCIADPRLPNGLSLGNGQGYMMFNQWSYNFLNISAELYPYPLNEDIPSAYQSFSNVTMLLSNIDVDNLNTNSSNMLNKSDILLANTIAFDCIFHACIQTYTASVSNGVLTETPGQQFAPDDSSQSPYGSETVIRIPRGYLPAGANLTFSIPGQTLQDFSNYFAGALTGNGTGSSDNGGAAFSSDILETMFHNGPNRIPESMRNVARAMTNNMRRKSTLTAPGSAVILETYIHVRWLWLLLPEIMVLASAVFLTLTVLQSKCWNVPTWRSSALAVMVHRIQGGGDRNDAMAPNNTIWFGKEKASELDAWAENVEAKLRRRGPMGTSYGLVAGHLDGCTTTKR